MATTPDNTDDWSVYSVPQRSAKNCKAIVLDFREDWEEPDGYWKCNAFSQLEGDEVFYYTVSANQS